MNKKQIIELLEKYNTGTISPDEKAILESWYLDYAAQSKNEISNENIIRYLEIIDKNLPLKRSRIIFQRPLLIRFSSAAAILIFISLGIYFYQVNEDKPESTYTNVNNQKIQKDIAPGGNKAILTLINGRKINLTDAGNGQLAEQSGIKITKVADGQLIYTVPNRDTAIPNSEFNIIETPRGGQYQVTLPDGTKIWLNAASSLKYPASFASRKERKVELNGEAYFEVAKDKAHPFIVNMDKQEVKVLGTHFNINAYTDETDIKTTLLEGSVKVSVEGHNSRQDIVKLKPGQQSVLTRNGLKVRSVDTEEAIAWKDGYFRFDDETLESIMRKISRWYDVDVIWNDKAIKDEPFAAVTTRFANVSKLLKILEQTGDARFKVEGKTITISKKK